MRLALFDTSAGLDPGQARWAWDVERAGVRRVPVLVWERLLEGRWRWSQEVRRLRAWLRKVRWPRAKRIAREVRRVKIRSRCGEWGSRLDRLQRRRREGARGQLRRSSAASLILLLR